MAIENSTTTATFAARAGALYDVAITCDVHEALRCLKGIGNAVHPFFGELEQKDKDNLLVGIIPLVNLIKNDLDRVFTDLNSLAVDMEKAETGQV